MHIPIDASSKIPCMVCKMDETFAYKVKSLTGVKIKTCNIRGNVGTCICCGLSAHTKLFPPGTCTKTKKILNYVPEGMTCFDFVHSDVGRALWERHGTTSTASTSTGNATTTTSTANATASTATANKKQSYSLKTSHHIYKAIKKEYVEEYNLPNKKPKKTTTASVPVPAITSVTASTSAPASKFSPAPASAPVTASAPATASAPPPTSTNNSK